MRHALVNATWVNATLLALALTAATLPAALHPAWAQDRVKRGEYLATIMDCTGCHTPGALIGKPEQARALSGSTIGFAIPALGIFYPPNLTPDRETGLGKWTEGEIVKAVRTGETPSGRTLVPIMPYHSYARLTDADAQALAAYLKSLKPIRHQAPAPTGPQEKPKAPYLTLVVPQ
ncbi:MAG: c-type cytochrome [Rhodospirillales bacterium]|nr:c-type cytochrome [Rhodospirillales bacterium]